MSDRFGFDAPKDLPIERSIEWGADNGFKFIDFNADNAPNDIASFGKARASKARALLEETELQIGVHPVSAINNAEYVPMLGDGKPCVVTLVERKTGYVQIGKLNARTTQQLSRRTIQLIQRQPRPVRTVTADNGTEFHGYADIERTTEARFYFATPHHAWERGTNENTNGLIRQYLPKRQSMASITQYDCNAIARKLNRRPRKRLGYQTPAECYHP